MMNFLKINEFKEVMLKYNFALKRLETELNIIVEEYTFNNGYNPVEHIKSRIKSLDSIINKLDKKGLDHTTDNIVRNVHDVVGMRIVCSFLSDVYEIVNIIKSSKEFIVKDESDYIKNPKDTGYSSYHLNVLVPVHLFGRTEYIESEIQIRTVAMDCWASLDHKLAYKLPEDIPEELRIEMGKKAKEIRKLDKSVQELYEIVKKYEKDC